MRQWPVEWMSSDTARQHASTKQSRLAGITTISMGTFGQPATASRVIFGINLFNSDVSCVHFQC